MKRTLAAREQIYDEFQRNAGPKFFFKNGHDDRFAAYYTSMFLIQDTAETLLAHREKDFSKDAYESYLEFWGVMQATVIQQDAIGELHKAIVGIPPKIPQGSAWRELREFRIVSAGHPASRTSGLPAPQRSFMGRTGRNYARVQYEIWDAHTRTAKHPIVNLGRMLDAYDQQAEAVLMDVLRSMNAQWP